MDPSGSETVKLLETPKAADYDLQASKDLEKERVTAFLNLPKGAVTISANEPNGEMGNQQPSSPVEYRRGEGSETRRRSALKGLKV